MCDEWIENMNNGKLNGVIFGITSIELKWLESYLSNREQQCCVNEQLSSNKTITCGVPQGLILGPLLFLLYINDLPECLRSTTPCMYADDTQIFSSSNDVKELVVKLNSDLAHVRNWLIENKLQMQPSKSKLMFIGSSYILNNRNTEQPLVVNNIPVSRTDTHKCLRVQIDEKLSWDSHIDMICKKASAGIGAMRRIKPFVAVDTLDKVYKSLVQPYFQYCPPLWDNCGKLLKDKLQRLQSRVSRVLTGDNYAPNKDKDIVSFFNNLLTTLQEENLDSEDNVIIGGDFNCPLKPEIDKKGVIIIQRTSVTACIDSLQNQLDLVDIWRIKNPDTRSFTWSQTSPRIFCRLDYWLISNNLNNLVKSSEIIPAPRTDHDAIWLEIGELENEQKGPGYWKMNCAMLKDEEYVNTVTEMLPV